jgi:hypothetical protein
MSLSSNRKRKEMQTLSDRFVHIFYAYYYIEQKDFDCLSINRRLKEPKTVHIMIFLTNLFKAGSEGRYNKCSKGSS